MTETGGAEVVADPEEAAERQSAGLLRIILIFIVTFLVVAIAVGAWWLARDVQPSWGLLPVLRLLATGLMIVLSGVAINVFFAMIKKLWQLDMADIHKVQDFLRELGQILRRPPGNFGIAAVVVLVGLAAVWPQQEPELGLEPGELVIMTAFPADPRDARTMLLEQWNRLNPDNHARFAFAPGNHDQQHARMVADAKRGEDRESDIYSLDIVWMAEFIQRGYIQQVNESALTTKDQGDFMRKVIQTCEDASGKLWALPLNSDVGLYYLRADLPGIVPPKDWDGYFGAAGKNMAIAARASDPRIEAATAVPLNVDDEMLTIAAMEAMWAAGGQGMVAPNGEPAFTQDGHEIVFDSMDLTGLEKLAAAYRDPEVTLKVEDADAATQAFIDGRVVYMRNWPVAGETIGDEVPDVAVAPPHSSVLGGQNLAIAAGTKRPRAAQALIQFFTNAASQQILSEVGGFVPTRQSALTYAKRPDAQYIQAALNNARLRVVDPQYVRFSQVFRQCAFSALNNNGKLPDGCAAELARTLQ